MKHRNAYCSFCRKSYRDVGPLVEGPGDVYICGECVELCQSIIVQEKRRRQPATDRPPVPAPEAVRTMLDQLVAGWEEAKEALIRAALEHYQRPGGDPGSAVLFVGPARSSRAFLARALAHALGVPFAAGDAAALVDAPPGIPEHYPLLDGAEPLLYELLRASDFDAAAAQRGVVYADGADDRATQDAVLRLWQGRESVSRRLGIEVARLLFICGGEFAGLEMDRAGVDRPSGQGPPGDALPAFGVMPELARSVRAIVWVSALDEETLVQMVPWVDLDRMAGGGA
jgi:ATP-dependent Clp protease ATP-binding subunit ClpX